MPGERSEFSPEDAGSHGRAMSRGGTGSALGLVGGQPAGERMEAQEEAWGDGPGGEEDA